MSYLLISTQDELSQHFQERWPYFSPHEIFSPDCYALAHGNDAALLSMLDPTLMDCLQSLRDELAQPFVINHGEHTKRGVRTFKDQASLPGGAAISQHCFGRAVDVTIKQSDLRSPRWVSELAETAASFGFTGIGTYANFVHLDIRETLNKTVTRWSKL